MEFQGCIDSTHGIGMCCMEQWDMHLSKMQLMQNSNVNPKDLKEKIELE